MKKQIIAVDVDWVLAKLVTKWLLVYNTIFNDNLTINDVVSWNMKQIIKEEAKPYMNNILNLPGFYRDLDVVDDCVRVLEKLSENYEIIFVTDPFTKEALKSKFEWLQEHFPFISTRNYVFTGNKSVILADYLIDDGVHNFEGFKGIPLLFDAPYNRDDTRFYRVLNWQDIEHSFECKLDKIIEFYTA